MVFMTPTQILGVKLHFLELDSTDTENEFKRPAYGIKKVMIKRPGTALSY